jgi:NADH-ubiquinone oxidoreductase chain 2
LVNITIYKKGLGIINGLFYVTSITHTFKIFIYTITFLILLLTSFYPRKYIKNNINNLINITVNTKDIILENIVTKEKVNKEEKIQNEINLLDMKIIKQTKIIDHSYHSLILNKKAEQFTIIEYTLIILLVIIGAMFLLSTCDFVSLFICIELQSYGLYILCALYKNSELSTSAALTYFLLGGLASCFILLGSALMYSNSANFNIDGLQIINSLSSNNLNNLDHIVWYTPNYISYSLLVLAVGLLFKISAAPFHIWSPDVYDNIPTIVTTFVALIPKISILIFMLELVHYSSNIMINTDFNWTSCLLLSSLFSLIIGTVLGLTQSRIKRLFAYSTISHLGFILLALSINSIESNQSFLFYLIQYTVTNLNAFIILLTMGYGLFFYVSDNIEYDKLQDKNNSPIQLINQIKGYQNLNPMLALSFSITLFSFVGIPPLIGFFAKQMVLSSALDKGYVFLVLVAILTSVIAAVYYLGIIRKMYFDTHEYILIKWGQYNINNTILSSHLSITISIITNLILLFIIVPQEFLNLSNIMTLIVYTSN